MSHYPAYPNDAYGHYPIHSYARNGATSWEAQPPPPRQHSEGAFTNIRVKIADGFKLPPPIDFTQYSFKEVQSSTPVSDFEFEKSLLEKYRIAKEAREQDPLASIQIIDPWAERIEKLVQLGHPHDAVCMALSVHHASPDEKVVEFLHAYDQMLMMGFSPNDTTAALMHHQGNAGAAADALLAAADGT